MSLANWSDIIDICEESFSKHPVMKEQKFPRSIIIKRQKEYALIKVKERK